MIDPAITEEIEHDWGKVSGEFSASPIAQALKLTLIAREKGKEEEYFQAFKELASDRAFTRSMAETATKAHKALVPQREELHAIAAGHIAYNMDTIYEAYKHIKELSDAEMNNLLTATDTKTEGWQEEIARRCLKLVEEKQGSSLEAR